jgi:hypothetical protein
MDIKEYLISNESGTHYQAIIYKSIREDKQGICKIFLHIVLWRSRIMKVDDEKKTVEIMINLYCNKKHGTKDGLCDECERLLEYAYERLINCKFGNNKGTCGKCRIHCYKPDLRMRIVEVMRFSGPRMIYTHPVLALMHLMGELKRAD